VETPQHSERLVLNVRLRQGQRSIITRRRARRLVSSKSITIP
jgi:hypothetical protein